MTEDQRKRLEEINSRIGYIDDNNIYQAINDLKQQFHALINLLLEPTK